MKLLWYPCALLGLALAAACGADPPPTIDEVRGPLRLTGYLDGGGVATVDVTELDGAPIATVTCDPTRRQITIASPLDPASTGTFAVPAEAGGCGLGFTAALAAQVGRGLLDALTPEVALDLPGCDVVGGHSQCCATHDACYMAHECTAWSWTYTNLTSCLFEGCACCNLEAVLCLARVVT